LNGTKQYPSNTPRISSSGLLVEAAATNLAPYSDQIGNSTYWAIGSYVSNGVTAPDGSATAYQFSLPAAAQGVNFWGTQNTITVAASTTYTFSAWLKVASGSAVVALNIEGLSNHNSADITLTTTWTRYSFTFTMGAGETSIYPNIYSGAAGAAANNVVVWGP
jgi:hypothetical protein